MPAVLRGLTPRGRCLIAAGVAAGVCAIILDERDLLRVAALLVALPALSAVVLGLSRLRLSTARTVIPAVLSVGTPAAVHLTLHAGGRLPVTGMLLADTVPDLLGEAPRYAMGSLAPGTDASVVYPLTPRVRGRHTLGPAEVRIADPLGLVEVLRYLPGSTTLLVRPQLIELDGRANPAEPGGGLSGAWSPRHHEPDALVRPYRPGDDRRSVHWRSSARRDELMVRPQEQGRRAGTVVVLDVRAEAHSGLGPHSTLERAVSMAASAAATLARQGGTVRLVASDGRDLGAGEQALDHLALLTVTPGGSLAGLTAVTGPDELLAVLGTLDHHDARHLIDATAVAGPGRAVVLGADGSGVVLLRAAGWTVVLAPARSPLPQVWRQLCSTPDPDRTPRVTAPPARDTPRPR